MQPFFIDKTDLLFVTLFFIKDNTKTMHRVLQKVMHRVLQKATHRVLQKATHRVLQKVMHRMIHETIPGLLTFSQQLDYNNISCHIIYLCDTIQ